MGAWLKSLIAAACVAVIAYVGYTFIREGERAAMERAMVEQAARLAREKERAEVCKTVAERFRVWNRWAELGRPEKTGSEEERRYAQALADAYDC